MKIRALLVAMSVATVLTGCQNMDSNGLLSSGAEAFQAYSLSDAQVKTLSDQACQEMGHVALGHVKKGMQVALGTNAVRVAAASAGGIVGSLSQSQLGDLGEKLVNSQFSQRQEAEADDYSYDLLRQRGISPAGLATSFEKLAKLEEGRQSSMFDDHPASAERAQHIRDRMSADGIK
ncbi:M48 family metalloprotease [Escherichia coli]|nr:M48 family metalloprotease [Escherichia coli]EHJ4608100.1 M48 family metalloprotease [Escherichia coli]